MQNVVGTNPTTFFVTLFFIYSCTAMQAEAKLHTETIKQKA